MPDVIPRPKVVSIVGSRRCTRYGEAIAYKTAYELAEKGIMIVSGMAYGIDAFAPVVDVVENESGPIGNRSFGNNPAKVSERRRALQKV